MPAFAGRRRASAHPLSAVRPNPSPKSVKNMVEAQGDIDQLGKHIERARDDPSGGAGKIQLADLLHGLDEISGRHGPALNDHNPDGAVEHPPSSCGTAPSALTISV